MRYSRARTRPLISMLISSPNSTETARSPAGRNRNGLERREGGVRQVGDEHVPRAVRDHEWRPGGERDGLGRDAARPEDRHVTGSELLRVAPVGAPDVLDAERGRVADVDRGAVGPGEPRARGHGLRELAGGDRAHRDDHGPVERARRAACDRRPPHRDVLPLLDVPEADPRLEQRPLERERAAQEEGDEVAPPVGRRVRHLVGEDAVLVDAVLRDVRSEVGARRHADGLRRADVGHFQERARARVALAEEQEIVGGVPREHREVRLDEVLPQAGRDTRELAPPDVLPDLPGVARVDGHGRILLRARPARSARSRRSALRVVCGRLCLPGLPRERRPPALPLDRRGVYLYGLEWALAKARRRGALLPVVVGLALPATAFQASIAVPASQSPYNWFHLLWP